jgi:hypothetical protein
MNRHVGATGIVTSRRETFRDVDGDGFPRRRPGRAGRPPSYLGVAGGYREDYATGRKNGRGMKRLIQSDGDPARGCHSRE